MDHSIAIPQHDDLNRIVDKVKNGQGKSLDLRQVSLSGQDLSNVDLSGVDLSGADLSGTDLSGAVLFRANLCGASLYKAKMHSCELSGADLSGANMEEADISNAGLGMAVLRDAKLFNAVLEKSTLSKADLRGADMRCAKLNGARLRETDLSNADFTGANLRNADLSLSNVNGAVFTNAELSKARLRLVKNYQHADWIGVDLSDINMSGAYMMKRHIMDENYLKEFRESSNAKKAIYYLWWLTSDCGRSITRWMICILLQVVSFALIYPYVGIDYGDHQTFLSPLYFSIVTLTTLGYGDILPSSVNGQIVTMVEVATGYIMLGGLMSIFSNKLARRAE